MNYDTMSVNDLLQCVYGGAYADRYIIESALRRRAVKDASTGTMKLRTRPIMGENQYGNKFQTGHIQEQVTEPLCLLDGDYLIIPTEKGL